MKKTKNVGYIRGLMNFSRVKTGTLKKLKTVKLIWKELEDSITYTFRN